MKKLLSLFAMAGVAFLLCSCSSDDDEDVKPAVNTPQLLGKWSQVNDADLTRVTTLEFTTEPYINYSASHTAVNPTIPENCPTYTKTILVDPSLDPTQVPVGPVTKEYTRQQGYFTVSGNMVSLWPQVSRTSTDGSNWTEVPAANLPSMELYTYTFTNANVLVLTLGNGTRQTFLK